MAIRKTPLVKGEFYHIVLRAVGNEVIFKDKDDYYRGIFSLFEFNDANPVSVFHRRRDRLTAKKMGLEQFSAKRDLLVDILTFNLMPNHIHLLVKQLKDKGITNFMQKLGTGYAGYFNKKYNRKGHLFSKFRSIHVKDNEQLKTVFVYIHANPISLIEPGWKEVGIKNPQKVLKFLENYKWSSYQDYIGKKNFPSVTERDFLMKIMGGEKGCRSALRSWVKHKRKLKGWDKLGIE